MSIRSHYSDTVVHFFQYGYLLLIPLLQLLMPGADRLNRTVLLQLATACGMILFFDLRCAYAPARDLFPLPNPN